MATGDLADALDRDLRTDQLTFDELGWRGLWAYITKAQPGTAIFHDRTKGFNPGDELTLEVFNEIRELHWRYTALHFQNGKNLPFPQRITRQLLTSPPPVPAETWETVTIDELVSPEVRALLQA